jgi:uncharacterized protein (DUF1015 family)
VLKISLDEAYVFDLLAIYATKVNNSTGDKKEMSIKSFKNLSNEVAGQIGNSLYQDIINSDEYRELLHANQVVFDLVDRAGETELSKITADANYERYLKKVNLQKKFFTSKLTEVKI